MALRLAESFESYVLADILLHWTDAVFPRGHQSFGGGRSGTGLILSPDGDNGYSFSYIDKVFDNQATWVVGQAWYTTAYGAGTPQILTLLDGGTNQFTLEVNGFGQLYVTRNGTVLGTSVAYQTVRLNAWNYIECKVTISSTVGAVEVRVNGQTVISLTAVNTQATANAYAQMVLFSLGATGFNSMTIDDIYICDGTGSINNDFLGDVRIQPLFPATSVLSQFTASGASANWLCVKEHAEDGDTTFVYTASGAQADLYGKDQIVGYTGGIPGIYVRTVVRKDDAGTRIIAPIMVSGTATGVGPQTSLSNSYISVDAVFEIDPNTSALWTIAALNAAAIGVSAVQ